MDPSPGRKPVKRITAQMLRPLFAALLCLPCATAICQSPQHANSKMEQEFQSAMAAEDRGDFDLAESLLAKLHKAHAGNFAIDESLGLLYAQREEYARALPLLKAATTDRSASDVAHANLGAALYKMHSNAAAAIEFERAIEINPANGSALESLAQVRMEQHRPSDAAKALTAALALKSGDPDLQLDCAAASLDANRLEDARKILSNFADADHSARAQGLLGTLDEKQKDYAGSRWHLTRAAELEPSEENAWQLAEELLRHWTFEPAAVEFEAASAKFPESTRLRLGLGAALFGDAKYAQAIPVFADLLDREPDNAEYAGMLGMSCAAVVQGARPQCATLVHYAEAHPADARASAHAAAFLLGLSDSQDKRPVARKLLEAALAADPRLPEAQYQMGTFLQDDGQWKQSIAYLERAVALKSDFSKAHYRLALAYWRSGRKQEGEVQMELQKKFSRQEQDDRDRRLRQITTFVVDLHR